MQPGDLEIEKIKGNPATAAECDWWRGSFLVIFADGAVCELAGNVPCSLIAQFATIHGAASGSREQSLAPYILSTTRLRDNP